jgi:lysozyme
MDKVAKRDMIGTGHPITYCNGLTSHDGKVHIGQRFTKEECDKRLAEALPKYLEEIGPCIARPVPVKVAAALLDGAWNAGSHRVCTSPMVANINAGKIRAGCNAFAGWIIRSDGQVRKGLMARRDGEDHGDPRLSEKGLCLQGVNDPKSAMYSYAAQSPVDGVIAHATSINSASTPATPLPKPRPAAAVAPAERACWFWRCK